MELKEKLEAVLSHFLGETLLIYREVTPIVFRSTPPGTIIKKGKTLEKKWKSAGIPSDIIETHLKPSIKFIDANELVLNNPYYQNITPTASTYKDLRMEYVTFKEREVDIIEQEYLTNDLKIQIPMAIHTKNFKALALGQKNRTWMSITPNEILTMKPHIENAHGKVFTAGLGLGYFAYMCALKTEVESVTILEGNPDIIEFFNQNILPQFGTVKDKIKIINSDYYEYIDHHNIKKLYDYSFIDIHLSGAQTPEVYCLSEEVLYHYKGDGAVHYWLEEGVHLKMKMGLALALYNKFVEGLSDEESLMMAWQCSLNDETTFRLFAKISAWVYRNVYTLGSSEEAFHLIFNPNRYKMLAAYTEHLPKS